MDRRNLLKTMGVATGTALLGTRAYARETDSETAEPVALLVDTTRCIGCRTCEAACAAAHADAGVAYQDDVDMATARTTSEKHWTVVNRFATEKGEVFVKSQCMHCLQPACASACLTRAMHKTSLGPVDWTADKCMGCRFCMVSCPFDVPKFEYFSSNPRIQKCVLCYERVKEGKQPACVENCPAEALSFGPRSQVLEEARKRMYNEPDKYFHQIYGEHEAGGTGVLYLASVPFDQLGFRKVALESYPALTREFLYAVPVVLTLVPPLLVGLNRASRARAAAQEDHQPEEEA